MTRNLGESTSRRALAVAVGAILLLAITTLPAGVGNVGRGGSGGGGKTETKTNPTFTVVIDPNDPFSVIRDEMVAAINAHPDFQASSTVDPHDPNSNSFQILRAGGDDVGRLEICAADPNLDHIGVSFPSGRQVGGISLGTAAPAGDGSIRLLIHMWDSAEFDQTFSTSGLSLASLGAQIASSLASAGFLAEDPDGFSGFSKRLDTIMWVRIDVTDSSMTGYCVRMRPKISSGIPSIPTVSQVGMFVLALLITTMALFMLRKRVRLN